jgi:hypothetical protein
VNAAAESAAELLARAEAWLEQDPDEVTRADLGDVIEQARTGSD